MYTSGQILAVYGPAPLTFGYYVAPRIHDSDRKLHATLQREEPSMRRQLERNQGFAQDAARQNPRRPF